MREGIIKRKAFIILMIIICLFTSFISFARSKKDVNDKILVLLRCKIIDDGENLDFLVTRKEFAKMIIKASPYKDTVTSDSADDFSPYIKKVLIENYMSTRINGDFDSESYITLSDVSKATLTLLGYSKNDFKGNIEKNYIGKFRDLGLDDNTTKTSNEPLAKLDVINIMYNVLKENIKDTNKCYGMSIFNKLKVDTDYELISDDMVNTKLEGPYIVFKKDNNIDFVPSDSIIYINGKIYDKEKLLSDLDFYGYVIWTIDKNNNVLYAYTESAEIDASVGCKKGYLFEVNYYATDMTLPKSVVINDNLYYIESEDMKYAFSYAGNIKKDDLIYFVYNKMNDKTNSYRDKNGKLIHENEDAIKYYGSIIYAFKGND